MTAEKSEPGSSPFQIEIESPQQWERVLRVEVSRDHFDSEYTKRMTRAVRGHQRPGFRKGKTPRSLVEKELGDQLRAETFESIVPQVFQTAVIEHKLMPITDPELRDLHFEDGEPITFELRIEVRPRIEAKNYENLAVKRREIVVPNAAVDRVLERLCESRAIWEKVDRPAGAGDQLVMDVTPLNEEPVAAAADPAAEPPAAAGQGQVMENQQLVLGEAQNLPAFEEGLAGAEAGSEREIETAYPDDYPREDLRGRTLRFRCAVKAVQQKILPEIDDAFAAQVAEGKTLLELRGEIRSHLERDAEAGVRRELDEQIVDRLVAGHEVEVPPSLVEQYLNSSVEELHARNSQMGKASSEEEDRQFREMTRPVAERVLQGMFVMEAVRRQEEISVSDEEIEARVVEIAHENGFDVDQYREHVARGGERDKIRHGLAERKTFDFLLSRAQVETVPHDTAISVGPAFSAGKAAVEEGEAATSAAGSGKAAEAAVDRAENRAEE